MAQTDQKKIPSSVFASKVDAHVRQYIDSKIEETVAPIRDDIASAYRSLSTLKGRTDAGFADKQAQIQDLVDVLEMSTSRLARVKKFLAEEE